MATNPPATTVDTTNVVGEPGAAPLGATPVSGSIADTEATQPGNAPNPAAPPASQPDTSGAGTGSNLPSNYHPTNTSATGTVDTVTSDGNVRRQAAPAYRPPSATPAAAVRDTTWTDVLGVGPAPANTMSLYAGTIETASIGSATSAKTTTENLLFNTTGNTVVKTGVLPAAPVTVVNKGQIIAVAAESHVIAVGAPFTLTNNGVTSTGAQLVVKKGSTTLVAGTDYTATPSGSGATANFSIVRVGTSTATADGDTVTVGYSYGNAKFYANATLTPTTDYTKAYTGDGPGTALKITRVNTAASTNGDTVAVTYTYGDSTYYESNSPAAVPGAPTIGAVTAKNKAVTVNWTAPSGNVDISYYIVQCVPGYGQKIVAANLLKTDFTQLTPAMPYKFQVAAVNSAGQGVWSALSATATPLNTDAVPTGSLAPENVVNPIYNIDGTIKAGTGLGPQ